MDETLIKMIVTALTAIVASSGFWTYMIKKDNNKSATTQMLLGLGHDRIIFLGMKYIDRGWLCREEYENLFEYLYEPYVSLGGNGTAKKIMEEVMKLPIKKSNMDYQGEFNEN